MSLNEPTYAAEQLAFADTPLIDRFDRRSLMLETAELAAHAYLRDMVGDVTVEETSVRFATHAAEAQRLGNKVRFAPNVMSRYVAVHELSHLVHYRSGLPLDSHGPYFRGVYAQVTSICYGRAYGRLLLEAFHECDLDVADVSLPQPAEPAIDIDRLADRSSGSRWL